MTDLNCLHASIPLQWKPESFYVKVFDEPGNSSSSRLVNLLDFCPNKPNPSLQYGNSNVSFDSVQIGCYENLYGILNLFFALLPDGQKVILRKEISKCIRYSKNDE